MENNDTEYVIFEFFFFEEQEKVIISDQICILYDLYKSYKF